MPQKLLLYWTEEPRKEDALMVFPCLPERVDEVVAGFSNIIDHIKQKNFNVVSLPEARVCKKCDIRSFCIRDGLIQL